MPCGEVAERVIREGSWLRQGEAPLALVQGDPASVRKHGELVDVEGDAARTGAGLVLRHELAPRAEADEANAGHYA